MVAGLVSQKTIKRKRLIILPVRRPYQELKMINVKKPVKRMRRSISVKKRGELRNCTSGVPAFSCQESWKHLPNSSFQWDFLQNGQRWLLF
ncbi:hypothetical protein CsSME_00047801 [Camellia sinensis var. sinensis]